MTNNQIIFNKAVELLEAGTIHGTGRTIECVNMAGETVTLEEPEAIHTFAEWKAHGFMVKRGEHAVAKFPIWKPVKKRTESDDTAADSTPAADDGTVVITASRPYMIMVDASFFAAHQVEAIRA